MPRLGVAYDLGGKSVVKATWGLYNYILGDTYGDVFAATATANAVFLWHDLNNDKLWTPNESNLSLAAGNPDFVTITAASNYELSPELKQPNTWETTVSYERELAPSLGIPRDVHQQDRQRQPRDSEYEAAVRARTTYPSPAAILVLTGSLATATTRAASRCMTTQPHTRAPLS